MKKLLLPYWHVEGTGTYPDKPELFQDMTLVELNGKQYWACTYAGTKQFYGERPYSDYEAWLATQPVLTGIYKLTPRAFHQRFTSGERKLLRESVEDVAVDLLEELQFAKYVHTKDPTLLVKLQELVTIGILTEGRPETMLVDGTQYEAYEG